MAPSVACHRAKTGARLLIGRQRQRLVWWTPAVAAPPAVVPPPPHANRTQARLYPTRAPRLHAASLLAPWTPRREWPRVVLKSTGGELQHGFQKCRRCRAPCSEYSFFVLSQAVITMCVNVLPEAPTKLRQRLYDLIREVVEVHRWPSSDPPRLPNSGGSLSSITSKYPASLSHR
jgi:hypothetical protein